MKELSPREALKQYRLSSRRDQYEQAEMFRSLPEADRMELLFYMLLHLVAGVQALHASIDPEAAKTTSYKDFGDSTETH